MERDGLLAAIAADPDAVENWLVYADWLSEHDDPRGELINLELAIEAGTASADAIDRHRELGRDESAFLSPRLENESHHLALTMWRGFIRSAQVFGAPDDPPTHETLAALYSDPHACVLKTLDLTLTDDLHAAIGTLRCESVRALEIGRCQVEELQLEAGLPQLRSLHLGVELGSDYIWLARLEHSRLEWLFGSCPALFEGGFELPKLETFGPVGHAIRLFEPRALLGDPPPLLANLSLYPCTSDDIRALRGSRLLGQLRSLTIEIDEAILEELARSPRFREIELVVHSTVETLEEREALLRQIAETLPHARVDLTDMEADLDEFPPPPVLEPAVSEGIQAAMSRLADRLRRR